MKILINILFYNKNMHRRRVMNLLLTTFIFLLSTLVFVSVLSFSTLRGQVNTLEENMTVSEASFQFIQSSQSGSLSQINDTTYSLELNQVADKTISYSDRACRIIETIDTSKFISNWPNGENSFAIDPPNAALIVLDNSDLAESQQDIALVELFSPVYDEDVNALIYYVRPINGTLIDLPIEFGQSTMIIDRARLLHWTLGADRVASESESSVNHTMYLPNCK